MDVFFLFPGGVFGLYLCVTGNRTDKEPTGQKSFVCFGTSRRDTEFRFRVSILFLRFFTRRSASFSPCCTPIPIGWRVNPRYADWWMPHSSIAVCVGRAVPVASGAWHALVWVKVLAR